jgi:hypothetical protein
MMHIYVQRIATAVGGLLILIAALLSFLRI